MIRHRTARRIACNWHGGGGSALYALCSTGAIDTAREGHNAADEIRECVKDGFFGMTGGRELSQILEYVERYGPRPPIDDWMKRYGG